MQVSTCILSCNGMRLLTGLLAVAVEEGHVDPAAFVGVVKVDDVGFVKEVGVKDDCAVLAVRNGDGFGSAFFQESLNFMFVLLIIICGKVPMIGRFLIPDHQPA